MSIGDVLTRALSDTLMGMGTVFVILILICLVISLFKFIPKGNNEHKTVTAKTQARESNFNKPAAEMVTADDTEEDEEEIVAVIMAAIMMAKQKEKLILQGAPEEIFAEPDYVVRSIRRRR